MVGAVVLLAPTLILLGAFTYWPVLRVFDESFLVGRFAGESAFGFGNYLRLFADLVNHFLCWERFQWPISVPYDETATEPFSWHYPED